jgi:hypothetical protein
VQLRTVEQFSRRSVYCYCRLLYELISDILLVIIPQHLIFHNLRPIIIVVDRPEVWTTNKRHSLALMHYAMCNQWHVGCTSCTLEAVTYTVSCYDEGRNNSFQYTYVSRHRPKYTLSYKNTSILILTALSTSKSHKARTCCWSRAGVGNPRPFLLFRATRGHLTSCKFFFIFRTPKTKWIKDTEICYYSLKQHIIAHWEWVSESRSTTFLLAIYRININIINHTDCEKFLLFFSMSHCNIFRSLHVTKTRQFICKCTIVQALRLCTGRTAHRGSRGIAVLFHDHGTRRR